MNVKANNKAGKYRKIMEKKIEMKPEILCEGLLDEFREYFKYVRELQFTEEPNYEFLLGLLNNAMKKNKIKNDFKFDWCISDNTNISSEKFISTENLFSKLKLGGINFNEDKGKVINNNDNKDKNNKKENEINDENNQIRNKIKENNDNENKINENINDKNDNNGEQKKEDNNINENMDLLNKQNSK